MDVVFKGDEKVIKALVKEQRIRIGRGQMDAVISEDGSITVNVSDWNSVNERCSLLENDLRSREARISELESDLENMKLRISELEKPVADVDDKYSEGASSDDKYVHADDTKVPDTSDTGETESDEVQDEDSMEQEEKKRTKKK